MSEPCTQPDGCTEPANASMCAHVLNSISTTVMQRCCKVTSESCTRKGVEADLTLHGPSSDQTWIGLLNRFVFILSQISGWTVLDPLKNVERSKAQMQDDCLFLFLFSAVFGEREQDPAVLCRVLYSWIAVPISGAPLLITLLNKWQKSSSKSALHALF